MKNVFYTQNCTVCNAGAHAKVFWGSELVQNLKMYLAPLDHRGAKYLACNTKASKSQRGFSPVGYPWANCAHLILRYYTKHFSSYQASQGPWFSFPE